MAESQEIIRLHDTVQANLAGGFASNTNLQIESWLRGSVTKRSDVSWESYIVWLVRHDGLDRLEAAKSAGMTAAVRTAAGVSLIVANLGESLRLSNNEIRGVITALVPAIFSTAERDDLLSFSDSSVTRAEFYSVPRGLGAIDRARRYGGF